MKFKYLFYAVAMMATMGLATTSCSDDDENDIVPPTQTDDDDDKGDPTDGADMVVSGDVSGTWTAGTTVAVTDHITVPEGQSLTIEEGVTIHHRWCRLQPRACGVYRQGQPLLQRERRAPHPDDHT